MANNKLNYNYDVFETIMKELEIHPLDLFLQINPKTSTIVFRFQNGPIKEYGINGVQIDNLGKVWLAILKEFNKKFPCRENAITITKIEEALLWQMQRKINREKRGVEGTNTI
jgi:hypothetical protein